MSLSLSGGNFPMWVSKKELKDYKKNVIQKLDYYVLEKDCPHPAVQVNSGMTEILYDGKRKKR